MSEPVCVHESMLDVNSAVEKSSDLHHFDRNISKTAQNLSLKPEFLTTFKIMLLVA